MHTLATLLAIRKERAAIVATDQEWKYHIDVALIAAVIRRDLGVVKGLGMYRLRAAIIGSG